MPLQRINQIRQITWKIWDVEDIPYYIAIDNFYSTYRYYYFCSDFDSNDKWQITLKFSYDAQGRFRCIMYPDIDTANDKAIHHSYVELHRVREDNHFYPITRSSRRKNSIKILRGGAMSVFLSRENSLPITGLDNFTLRIRIKLITYVEDEPMFPPINSLMMCSPKLDVPDSIWELYDSRNISGDLIIKVQNSEFRAHKLILEQSCPALFQLINHQNDILIIDDVSPDIFSMILEYIYTGHVTDLDDNAEKLVEASHRFKLDKLKYLCEEPLLDNYLNYFHLGEAYSFAKRYKTFRLLSLVLRLINDLNEGRSLSWSQDNPPTVEEVRRKYRLPIYHYTKSELLPYSPSN